MNPVIGILYCGYENGRQFVSHSYIEAVSSFQGTPLVIPYSSSYDQNIISKYLEICDGFLFCGGGDVTPLLFNEELMTDKGHTDLKTDRFHLYFMKQVLANALPVLGICRGMQIMNLALGGTIWQDISLRPENSLNHMQLSTDRSDICHKVFIHNSSMLYKICGNTAVVNSFHHQCAKDLGTDLQVTAKASDGIIEAIESKALPFALGVQWHPECMYQADSNMADLFSYFIKFCKKNST